MTDRSLSLSVEGVRDTLTALRRVSGETPKEVSQYHKQVAEFVARAARPKAAGRPRKTHTGHIERAIKTSGTQREAAIKVSTADAKVQEFGGRAPLFGNRSRWYTVRAPNRDGYFLYPAIRETGPTVERIYLKGLDSAISRYWSRVG
jgi:hypothetical protein